jgi:putative methyltransferase (TIGR04325 family)
MNDKLKYILKRILPPVLLDVVRVMDSRKSFFGNYKTWAEACRVSGGYDSDVILNKVRDALLKVKSGEAVYERDSVLFDEIQHSWPLLAALLWIASRNRNKLTVVDFGGSLGSTYYQNRRYLRHLDHLSWNIIEQQKFVVCGKQHFEDSILRFYHSLDECLGQRNPHVILLSSVLQYLEQPYAVLADVVRRDIPYIIIDRTTVIDGLDDRLTVQQVPECIYPASYPAWFLNRQKLVSFFADRYNMIAEFDALAGMIELGDTTAHDKGFIFMHKTISE